MKLFEIGVIALTSLLSLVKAESVELTPHTIDQINSGTWLVEHFSPACGHCKYFAPIWKKVAEENESKKDFHFGTIDCITFGDLCAEHEIYAFPTVQLYKNGEKVESVTGSQEYEQFKDFVAERMKDIETNNNKEEEEEEKTQPTGKPDEEQDAVYASVNPEGLSVDLDGSRLNEIISSKQPWFIKFYSPSCPHCVALAPTWTKMASELRNQVNVAEVNCQAKPFVCEEHNIEYFPTLRMYGQGDEPLEYRGGDRSLISLVKYAKSNAGPAIKEVDASDLEKKLETTDVSLIYLYKQDTSIPDIINKMADQFVSTLPFYSSSDAKSMSKFGQSSADLPVVLVSKDNTFKVYPSHDFKNTQKNKESLERWIQREQYPLVSEVGPSNQHIILEGEHRVVLSIVDPKDTVAKNKLRDVAAAWAKTKRPSVELPVIFAQMDRSMWRDYVLTKFKIKHDGENRVVIYDPTKYEYYINDTDDMRLSLNQPQGIYNILTNMDHMTGLSALAMHEKMEVSLKSGFSLFASHWLLSMMLFTGVGALIYRYLTFHRPKSVRKSGGVLPSFKTVDTSHYD
ncbi:thioredoxin-like protein [Backusella circina FSU 941]|nr:thioredoxin-like protein [Backusella circina FSU 941]